MLIKILGGFDLITGIILIFLNTLNFPKPILFFFGIILIVKSSLGLLQDFASWVDFLGGLAFLLSIIINIPGFVSVIIGILVLQKGVFSFL